MKNKWRKSIDKNKVYWGEKYDYGYNPETKMLVIATLDRTINTTVQVKDFQTAEQIVECLEK